MPIVIPTCVRPSAYSTICLFLQKLTFRRFHHASWMDLSMDLGPWDWLVILGGPWTSNADT